MRQDLTGLRVVVIDDDIAVRDSMRTLLATWKCQVVVAGDADQAVSVARESFAVPDALVVDYRLREERTGVDAIKLMRVAFNAETPRSSCRAILRRSACVKWPRAAIRWFINQCNHRSCERSYRVRCALNSRGRDLAGSDGCLHAIGDAQCFEHGGHMRLYRCFGQSEFVGNALVGLASITRASTSD